jgi:hypothetical protein
VGASDTRTSYRDPRASDFDPVTGTATPHNSAPKFSMGTTVGLAVGPSAAFILAVLCITMMLSKRRRRMKTSEARSAVLNEQPVTSKDAKDQDEWIRHGS